MYFIIDWIMKKSLFLFQRLLKIEIFTFRILLVLFLVVFIIIYVSTCFSNPLDKMILVWFLTPSHCFVWSTKTGTRGKTLCLEKVRGKGIWSENFLGGRDPQGHHAQFWLYPLSFYLWLDGINFRFKSHL